MIAAALAALLAQTPAQTLTPAPAAQQCFDMSRFDRIRATRPDALFVRSGGRTYRIGMLPCPLAADPSAQIVLKARSPGPVCGPADLELTAVASGVAVSCAVQSITPLTDAQAEALPSKDRP